MDRRSARHETGLALVVVTGLLTLLAIFGTAWARMAFFLRERMNVNLDHAQARLLAHSGLQYASARLSQESLAPVTATVANQPDDWTYRDGPGFPLEKSANPSYAQTEPYDDAYPPVAPTTQGPQPGLGSTGNARYDARQDPFTDLDGNSRFDSWSGRLRDRHGLTGGTFVLKVLPESGKINLNGGWLDHGDRDGGSPWRVGPGLPPNVPYHGPNLTPDHCDVEETRNRRYFLLLNTLGSIAGVTATKSPANPAGILNLGDLLRGRPYRGFKSMAEVRRRLFLLDEKKGEENWRKVGDFLTVTGIERAAFSVSDRTAMSLDPGFADNPDYFEFYRHLGAEKRPLVNLSGAPRQVLQALVQGLYIKTIQGDASISADLASRTADFLSQSRFASWYDLFARLYRENPSIDPASAAYEASIPGQQAIFQAEKVDAQHMYPYAWANVVFANFVADEAGGYGLADGVGPYTYLCSPPMSWHTYDLPHATVPNAPRFHRLTKMAPSDCPYPHPWADSIVRRPYPEHAGGTLETSLIPREVSLFSVDCLGRTSSRERSPLASAEVSALFRFGAVVSARTQKEFENLGDAGASDGIDDRQCRVIGRPLKDRTQTEPQFSLDSLSDFRDLHPEKANYSPFWGTVRLADRSGYRQGERFYVPAWDVDQPLRRASGPSAFEANFLDAAGDFPASFRYTWDPLHYVGGAGSLLLSRSLAVFRGERATSLLCAAAPGVSAPGVYDWPADRFPLDDGSGAVSQGTVELWTTGRPGGLFYRELFLYWGGAMGVVIQGRSSNGHAGPISFGAPVNDMTLFPGAMTVNGHESRPIVVGDWHHLAVLLDPAAGLSACLDGIPDPFLANNQWDSDAINTARKPFWVVGWDSIGGISAPPPYPATSNMPLSSAVIGNGGYFGSEVDELRLYNVALDPAKAMAHALFSRYWTEERFPPVAWPQEISERLRAVPSFTSPFYLFDQRTVPQGAQWNGFVPQLIREAVDGPGEMVPAVIGLPSKPSVIQPPRASPLRVELLCYPGADPGGPFRAVPLPEALWRTGGGWVEFKEAWRQAYGSEAIPKFRGFRYRVWMDCSAIDGFNPETPVFDSISMAFITPGRWLDWSVQ